MALKKLIFIGSHLGYPMDRTPLGGGAMVGLQLVRHWPQGPDFELTVLGSGSACPREGLDYIHIGGPKPRDLVSLSELDYASFCRDFEAGTTQWLLDRRARFDPKSTCVLVNDISEGPTLAKLTAAGYPIVSLWHVDVVDYFNKLYLRNWVRPERLTRLYERWRGLGGPGAVPDVLRLIFEKQRETVLHSRRMILPSRTMAETVGRCYGGLLRAGEDFARRAVIVPWGVWDDGIPQARVEVEAAALREHYQIKPDSLVALTLSRISPEKGLHLLLEALRLVEERGRLAGRDVCLFICGEPAFMQGASYLRRVRRAAAKLKRTRVFFPGYLDAAAKRSYCELADLFVSPSVHESYGLNVVEAMRAGLPVLASDHYGVRDILSESFGRQVHYPSPAKAPPLLACALEELLSDPVKLAEMGRRAAAAAKAMPFSAAADAVLRASLDLLSASGAADRRLDEAGV